MNILQKDIDFIERLYEGRRVFCGEMLDHPAISNPIRNERDM